MGIPYRGAVGGCNTGTGVFLVTITVEVKPAAVVAMVESISENSGLVALGLLRSIRGGAETGVVIVLHGGRGYSIGGVVRV